MSHLPPRPVRSETESPHRCSIRYAGSGEKICGPQNGLVYKPQLGHIRVVPIQSLVYKFFKLCARQDVDGSFVQHEKQLRPEYLLVHHLRL